MYGYKGRTADGKFGKFDNALDIINNIKNGEIRVIDVKNNQDKFKSNLSDVKETHGGRTKERKNTLYNIEMLYKARNEAIKFFDNYSLKIYEAKTKANTLT